MTDPSIQATPPAPSPTPTSEVAPSVTRTGVSVLLFSLIFVALHAALWCALVAYLLFSVPRAEKLFRDFNMQLPALTIFTLAVARWVWNYWYVLLVWVFFGLGIDGAVLAWLYPRRRSLAWVWALLLLLLPLVVWLAILFSIMMPMWKLQDALSR
jgi:type II secretory pathway component PulF